MAVQRLMPAMCAGERECFMKKVLVLVLTACLIVGIFTGCRQSTRVSRNLSLEADNFNVTRQLTVINARAEDGNNAILFQMTGNFSIDIDSGAGKLKDRALQTMPITWDISPPSPEYFQELFRISKNQIIFGGNYFNLPPTRGVGCWDKRQPWENFSQWEMIWTSFDCPAFIIQHSTTGGANRETKIHPTQKPVAVYSKLLRKFAKSGDRILDTHIGSGSSIVACLKMGFDYIGFEIDKEYFDKANERIEAHKKQVTLLELLT